MGSNRPLYQNTKIELFCILLASFCFKKTGERTPRKTQKIKLADTTRDSVLIRSVRKRTPHNHENNIGALLRSLQAPRRKGGLHTDRVRTAQYAPIQVEALSITPAKLLRPHAVRGAVTIRSTVATSDAVAPRRPTGRCVVAQLNAI